MNKHILIIGVTPKSLIIFRGDLIKALSLKGYSITTLAGSYERKTNEYLKKVGVCLETYPVQRRKTNPFSDIKTYLFLRKYLANKKPNTILAYTIKPIIWGGFAAYSLKDTNFYAMIEGEGFTFQGGGIIRNILKKLVIFLYYLSLKKAKKVIFLNPDNQNNFIKLGIIPKEKATLINGIGVNISQYSFMPLPKSNPIFLSIGRLIAEKGFREYAQAAQIVKAKYPNIVFQLLGREDPSANSIPLVEVKQWHDQGWVEYLGTTDDVRPYLQSCHIFVLPSYYGEGLSRTILEAMSIGRPILTTDNVGCRETVTNGDNGYIVPKADAQALAERIIWFLKNREQWERMGKRSRELAKEKYDVHKVNARIMEIMEL